MKDQEIIIYREGFVQSIVADIFSCLFLLVSFGVNQLYIGSKFLSGILLVMFVIFLIVKVSKRKNVFHNKEDAVNYIQNL